MHRMKHEIYLQCLSGKHAEALRLQIISIISVYVRQSKQKLMRCTTNTVTLVAPDRENFLDEWR